MNSNWNVLSRFINKWKTYSLVWTISWRSSKSCLRCLRLQRCSECQNKIITCVKASTNDSEDSVNCLASKKQNANDVIDETDKQYTTSILVSTVIGIQSYGGGRRHFRTPDSFKWSFDNFNISISNIFHVLAWRHFRWNYFCKEPLLFVISFRMKKFTKPW